MNMRKVLTTIAEVAGFASIAAGCWKIAEPLGLIVGGVALAVLAFAASGSR